jgi:hypothetical protein
VAPLALECKTGSLRICLRNFFFPLLIFKISRPGVGVSLRALATAEGRHSLLVVVITRGGIRRGRARCRCSAAAFLVLLRLLPAALSSAAVPSLSKGLHTNTSNIYIYIYVFLSLYIWVYV